jgi:hypothetical protein
MKFEQFEQNFPKVSGMAVDLERMHAAPAGNAQVAKRAMTMWWWQQGVKMATTMHQMR